jgi:mRNA-degrading endonuclease toxin of MazEF toxin-antitoxin module
MSISPDRWGNSVGPRVPRPMLEQPGLAEGMIEQIKSIDWRARGAFIEHVSRPFVDDVKSRTATMLDL